MYFIDTHTHLFLEHFDNDRDKVVERAVENGIKKMYNPNVDISTIEKLLKISKKYPKNVFPLIGLHPGSVKKDFEKKLEKIQNYLTKEKFYGIGEVGIDLYWENNIKYKNEQIEAFRLQVKLAKKNKLPIVIHTRKAFKEVFEVIDKENDENLFGIFHCFTGNINQAKKIIEYGGFKLGIGGFLTYKNSRLQKVIPKIDNNYIVLETDSPFLTPEPHRGKRNESSYLIHIAKKLAQLKCVSIENVADFTTKNAMKIFK